MEKIVIRIEVDGVELAPVDVGEGREDLVYKEDIKFFSMGYAHIKDHTRAPYEYMFSLSRRKSEEELRKGGSKE